MKLTSLIAASGSTAKQMLRESVFERTEASPAMASETAHQTQVRTMDWGHSWLTRSGNATLSESNSPVWPFPSPFSCTWDSSSSLFFLSFGISICVRVCARICAHILRPEVAIGNHPPLLSRLAHWGRIFQPSLQLTMAHFARHLALGSLCLSFPGRWLWIGLTYPLSMDVVSGIWTLVPMLAWWIISLDHLNSFIKYMWSWKSLKFSQNQFFTLKHITFLRPLLGSK